MIDSTRETAVALQQGIRKQTKKIWWIFHYTETTLGKGAVSYSLNLVFHSFILSFTWTLL